MAEYVSVPDLIRQYNATVAASQEAGAAGDLSSVYAAGSDALRIDTALAQEAGVPAHMHGEVSPKVPAEQVAAWGIAQAITAGHIQYAK